MLNFIKPKDTNPMKNQKKNIIFNYIHKMHPKIEKQIKINETNFKIPGTNEYNDIIKFNYTIPMLKKICEHYKISKSGTKQELSINIYLFLFATNSIIKIQNAFRLYLRRKLIKLHGPAVNNKCLCVNDTDFLTMDNLNEVHETQFYSFKDDDNVIYGFDMSSILKAINRDNNFKNPYNRKKIPVSQIINDINSINRLNKIFKLTINQISEIELMSNLPISKQIQLKLLALCQKLDELGNYTDMNWFTTLNSIQIIKFCRELYDIWNYRAELTSSSKLEICPNGDPFVISGTGSSGIHATFNIYDYNVSHEELKFKMIRLIENLIYKGINRDSQFLGASFVLSALTLVNENAAQSMPWLYYSVAHIN